MIRLRGVSVVKDGRAILDGIDATLDAPRIGIVGANGSGKSTLAKLLNGLETPTRGTVEIDGTPVEEARRRVGFVFQNPDNQIVYPIVGEDLMFGLRRSGLPEAERRARIGRALAPFGLEGLIDRRVHELSGGEKQLVALVGVLVMEPDIVVLDEPTTGLDLANRTRLVEALHRLPQRLVIVSHDLDLMADMDHVVWIEAGRIAAEGEPSEVIAAYRASATGAAPAGKGSPC